MSDTQHNEFKPISHAGRSDPGSYGTLEGRIDDKVGRCGFIYGKAAWLSNGEFQQIRIFEVQLSTTFISS
jgi:hypothetical protein